MPRDNERITELLADAEKNMRQLLRDMNEAGAPWPMLWRIADMGGGLSQGLSDMSEGHDGRPRMSSGGAPGYGLRAGAMAIRASVLRPVQVSEEVAEQIAALYEATEQEVEQILKGAQDAIAFEASEVSTSEDETLIEPPQNE